MTEEFNLSEKIEEWREVTRNHVRNIDEITKAHMIDMIDKVEEDVKEFIRLLKEEIKEREKEDPQDSKLAYTFNSWLEDVCEIIDKLAGENLI